MALIVHFSGFASSCYQITRNEIDWSFFYFSMRHLPTPLSNSFQWQAQVHMSLKHTFVAADACVATTRLIWCARAWDLTLSNSDLLGTNRLDCSTAKLKGMSTLKVLTWVFSWVKEDPLIPDQLVIAGQNPNRFLKESSPASYLLFRQTLVHTCVHRHFCD